MNATMSRTLSSMTLVSVVALTVVVAASPAAKPAHQHEAAAALLVPEADLKWSDVPEFPGLKMAPLQGDPAKGASHFFLKMPAGFAAPLHFHNADHWAAVVAGTLVLVPEGGTEKRLPAGSGFSFVGKKKHTTACAAGADCLLFIDARGTWDVITVSKK
jgi:hypothetical protein